jgi:glycosyltransferase involved in cell wall biosynthesis
MKAPSVTVAIPTYNRACYIREAIESVLSQSFADFSLVIIDNASIDETPTVVGSITDPRIAYVRNNENVGMIGNWNRAVELCHSQYLNILGDDDKMLPGFLARSVDVLDQFPTVGFTFSHCNKVDAEGRFLKLWGYDFPPLGFLTGHDYLDLTVKYGCCLTNSSSVLLRRDVFDAVGVFQGVYGNNTFDFNMWLRIACEFDVYFIDEPLVDYRLHPGQVSELHWRSPLTPSGRLASLLEIIGAVSMLLRSEKASQSIYRKSLADVLTRTASESSQLMKALVPFL